jgi:hypothetical protein
MNTRQRVLLGYVLYAVNEKFGGEFVRLLTEDPQAAAAVVAELSDLMAEALADERNNFDIDQYARSIGAGNLRSYGRSLIAGGR